MHNFADKYQETNSPFNRRKWLQLCSMAAVGVAIPEILRASINPSHLYLLADVKKETFSLPINKTVPFNWAVSEISVTSNGILFNWVAKHVHLSKQYFFRLTSATDIRETCTLEVLLAKSKQKIGELDISYAHYMQPFELLISSTLYPKILQEGIIIKMIKGSKPFWFFSKSENKQDIPDAFLPHLLVSDKLFAKNTWQKTLLSKASLSTFGWMEGCVLDGIGTMLTKQKNTTNILEQHLEKYFANDTLVYENLNNQQSVEKITTVESILPFAMLALHHPQHAMLKTAIDFCINHADENGVIADDLGTNRRLKTEECYTISYPLAILSKILNRPDLQAMALANLQARVNLLAKDNRIYQNAKELEAPAFAFWARGVGWYLLGLAKTLAVLPNDETTKPLRTALLQGAEVAINYQQSNGLWYCFLHEKETGVETSGSANIAAALAYGYSQNLLPISCKRAAQKCYNGLQPFFTSDGFLTGSAQVNKGGEALQRNGFRVISPYSLGFIGILETAINKN